MAVVVNFVAALIWVLTFAIVIRALLSWFPLSLDNPLVVFLFQITEPVLAPLRRIIPRAGFLDLTPMIAIVVLQLVLQLIYGLAG